MNTTLTAPRPSQVVAVLRLLRPGSAAASAAICAVGAFLARPVPGSDFLLALAAVAFAVAASNVFNDLRDVEADRLNVPGRPLPAGEVSLQAAGALVASLGVGAVVSALAIDRLHGMWVAVVLGIGLWYSAGLKRILILGPLTVGALLASAMAFGASLGNQDVSSTVLIGSLEVALFTFGRESLKGIRDTKGDRRAGVATIAARYGRRSAVGVFIGSSVAVAFCAVAAGVVFGEWYHAVVMSLLVAVPAWLMGGRVGKGLVEIGRVIDLSAWLWVTGLVGIALLGVS